MSDPSTSIDKDFTGSIPQLYETYLVPLIFEPYAADIARRITRARRGAGKRRTRQNDQFRQLADVIVLASLPIAGCTLAVSVVAGLNDRRRPFALLRLTGARLRTLRRVVVLESAVPLLAGAVLAAGVGFLTAGLLLRSQLGYALHPPDAVYYVVVVAGLLLALLVLASTLPVLRRITDPETARFE